MKGSGKIIIKPRRTKQPSPPVDDEDSADDVKSDQETDPEEELNAETPADDAEPDTDSVDSDAQNDDNGNDNAGGSDDENESQAQPPLTTVPTRGRGRGRGRGRARGTTFTAVPSTPRPRGRPRGSGRGRGRGRGSNTILLRLPKRNADSDNPDGTGAEEDSQVATPGGDDMELADSTVGAGKPFRKIQGQIYIIENDEFITEDDSIGDAKIDKDGNLLGERKFKAQTFILPNRHPTRKYMLAIEAARTSGFRDSLYYFRRNLLALKLNATQPEKDYLIDAGVLQGHLRTRSVTLITARSAYKLHGAKMVVDGKLVVDDYYEAKALEEITAKGFKAGDPYALLKEYDDLQNAEAQAAAQAKLAANQLATSGQPSISGGLSLYRTGGPSTIFGGNGLGPFSDGPLNAVKKASLNREGVSEENWMHWMAERTRELEEAWLKARREALRPAGGLIVSKSGGSSVVETSTPNSNSNMLPNGSNVDGQNQTRIGSPKRTAGSNNDAEGAASSPNKKLKRHKLYRAAGADNDAYLNLPLGVYEPHSAIIHYKQSTQPSRARWEQLPSEYRKEGKGSFLGGTKAGNGAWALAWVDTVMELPVDKVDGMDEDLVTERTNILRDTAPLSNRIA